MVLFLSSELMFFGGLFAAYFTLRSNTSPWPPFGVNLDMGLTIAATVLLTASSFTMHAGTTGLRRGDHAALRRWMSATFGLGTVFLAIKGYELATAHFGVASHAYGTLFFTMLGAHAVHLAVGLVLIPVVVARAARGAYGPANPGGPEAVGAYWHFVDAVWLAIFATIYLIR